VTTLHWLSPPPLTVVFQVLVFMSPSAHDIDYLLSKSPLQVGNPCVHAALFITTFVQLATEQPSLLLAEGHPIDTMDM